MTRRSKPKRTKPDIDALIELLCSGVTVTVHDVTSGEYRNPDTPTGWGHATFYRLGNSFYMKGQNGASDWAFAKVMPRSGRIHLIHAGLLPRAEAVMVQAYRVSAAFRAIRYMHGRTKTLPSNLEIKAPAKCKACGRSLTAGRSLTLRCHPKHGMGFYGPICAQTETPEASRRAEGMARMNTLLANVNPATIQHVNNCPCHKCKG